MDIYLFFCCFLQVLIFSLVHSQRAPPGVNPQHYQHGQGGYQVPQQHMQQQVPVQHMQQQQVPMQHQHVPMQQQHVPMQQQQVPMQQQHVPMQQQQVPMQQQQVPMQQQQVPVQSGHHHAHSGQPQLLNTANMEHEKEHIAEHLEVPVDTSKMTEQELQFHYFKMHDADNNNKLDGCELIKSLIHWHEQGNAGKDQKSGMKIFGDEELVTLIDPILNVDDANKDGFIDYPEFVRAQQKAAAAQNQNKPT